MTRTTRLFGLAMVLALLMALVSTATAAPPDPCDRDPNHPLYPVDPAACPPTPSTTTTSTTATTVVPGSLGVGFSCEEYALLNPSSDLLVLSSWQPTEAAGYVLEVPDLTSGVDVCVDLINGDAGSLSVTVNSVNPAPKRNSILYALIKDSHPGDHCGTAEDAPGSALNLNLTNVDEETGTIDGTISGLPAATLNACGDDYADTSKPLAIMLGITGKPGITANITLTYSN